MKKSALVALLASTATPLLSMENNSRSSILFFSSTLPVSQDSQQPQTFSTPSRSTIPTHRVVVSIKDKKPTIYDLVPKHRRVAINNALKEGNNEQLARNLARILVKRPQKKSTDEEQKVQSLYQLCTIYTTNSLINADKQTLKMICQHSKPLLSNKEKVVQYLENKRTTAGVHLIDAEKKLRENAKGIGLIKWRILYLLKISAWSATGLLSFRKICSADPQPAIYENLSWCFLGLSAWNISTNLLNLYNHVNRYQTDWDKKLENLTMLVKLLEISKESNGEHTELNSTNLLAQFAEKLSEDSAPNPE